MKTLKLLLITLFVWLLIAIPFALFAMRWHHVWDAFFMLWDMCVYFLVPFLTLCMTCYLVSHSTRTELPIMQGITCGCFAALNVIVLQMLLMGLTYEFPYLFRRNNLMVFFRYNLENGLLAVVSGIAWGSIAGLFKKVKCRSSKQKAG